jgi:flagellar biosynthesis anti-sigma factor FlgM
MGRAAVRLFQRSPVQDNLPERLGNAVAPAAAAPTAANTDPLSARALEARGLSRDMAARPPVDSARVEALRADIGAGRYRIDPERLAGAMIRSEWPGRA